MAGGVDRATGDARLRSRGAGLCGWVRVMSRGGLGLGTKTLCGWGSSYEVGLGTCGIGSAESFAMSPEGGDGCT